MRHPKPHPCRILALPLIFSLVLLISYFKMRAGHQLTFSVFYLVPIYLAVRYISRPASLFIALVSAASFPSLDLLLGRSFDAAWEPWWNGLNRFVMYLSLILIYWLLEDRKTLSFTDHLTGLANRRYFDLVTQRELTRGQRTRRPLSIAYIDCDDFKGINDRFGHPAGDKVLQTVSDSIKGAVRAVDVASRIGGDEFAVLLPESDRAGSETVVRKLQLALERGCSGACPKLSFSIGLLTCAESFPDAPRVMKIADELMYSVKKNGKASFVHRVI